MGSNHDDDSTHDPDVVAALTEGGGQWPVFENVLGEMTPIYHEDNEWLDIVRADVSHAKPGGEEIGVQPDLPLNMDPDVTGPNILRLLDDLAAHETEHVNASDLDAKAEFIDQYENFGGLAGHVFNIVEDEYVDARRKFRFYGMRSKLAYYVYLHMNTPSRAPDIDTVEAEDGLVEAITSGLFQVALAGYMNGDPSDEVADAVGRLEPLVDRVRGLAKRDTELVFDSDRERAAHQSESQREREVIAHAIVQVILRYVPDFDGREYDADAMDGRGRAAGGDPRETGGGESRDADGPSGVDMDPETEAAVESLLEDMVADDDVPDPVSDPEVVEPGDLSPPDADDMAAGADAAEAVADALDAEMESDDAPDPDADAAGDSPADEMIDSMDADPMGGGDTALGEGEGASDAEAALDEMGEMLDEGAGGGGGASADGGPDRDIEDIVAEYGPENLVVR